MGTARGPDMNQSRPRERLYQRHLVSGLFISPQVGQHLQEEKKENERTLHHKLSQQQLCNSHRLQASSSSSSWKEGNTLKLLSFPLIPSFVSPSSVVGRLMTLLTFPIMAALRLEVHRIASNMYFLGGDILCFWSIELQHYKHHRIHEIGGIESRRGGGVCHSRLNFAIASLP